MATKNISSVVNEATYGAASRVAEYDDVSLSSVVAAALAFYTSLPGSARRAVRHIGRTGSNEDMLELAEECARAIARVGDGMVVRQLADRGRALGLWSDERSEEELAEEAEAAIRSVDTPAERQGSFRRAGR